MQSGGSREGFGGLRYSTVQRGYSWNFRGGWVGFFQTFINSLSAARSRCLHFDKAVHGSTVERSPRARAPPPHTPPVTRHTSSASNKPTSCSYHVLFTPFMEAFCCLARRQGGCRRWEILTIPSRCACIFSGPSPSYPYVCVCLPLPTISYLALYPLVPACCDVLLACCDVQELELESILGLMETKAHQTTPGTEGEPEVLDFLASDGQQDLVMALQFQPHQEPCQLTSTSSDPVPACFLQPSSVSLAGYNCQQLACLQPPSMPGGGCGSGGGGGGGGGGVHFSCPLSPPLAEACGAGTAPTSRDRRVSASGRSTPKGGSVHQSSFLPSCIGHSTPFHYAPPLPLRPAPSPAPLPRLCPCLYLLALPLPMTQPLFMPPPGGSSDKPVIVSHSTVEKQRRDRINNLIDEVNAWGGEC